MNFPFKRDRHAVDQRPALHDADHMMTSSYSTSLCRFVLDCSCGAHFDTPYIDEALEIRELHETLAPLADQLVP